jgi:hypothetical protein
VSSVANKGDVVKWGLTGRYLSKLPHNGRSTRMPCGFQWSSLLECYVANKWDRVACAALLKEYTVCVASERVDQHKLRTLNFHLRKVITHKRRS